MKKKSLFLSLLIMFSVVLLSACGVVGSKQVTGVSFSTNRTTIYDGKEMKCFVLDVNEEFKVPYKVYPNTAASDAHAQFSQKSDNADNSKYNFRNGTFKILSSDFPEEGILITITVNSEYTDECVVKLADYPDNVKLEGADAYIQQNGTYAFSVVDNVENKIDISNYNFYLESSDNSVIRVGTDGSLMAISTGKRGSAKISVYFITDGGKKTFIGEKVLTVVMNAALSKIVFDGTVLTNDTINLVSSPNYLNLEVYLMDEFGVAITDFDYSVNILQGESITIDSSSGIAIKAELGAGIQTEKCIIEVVTNALNADGEYVKLRLTINLTATA